jgi:hypothetical protein
LKKSLTVVKDVEGIPSHKIKANGESRQETLRDFASTNATGMETLSHGGGHGLHYGVVRGWWNLISIIKG